MISTFLLIFFLVFSREPVIYHVVYETSIILDLDAPPHRQEMILSVGQGSSRYCEFSFFKLHHDKRQENEPVITSGSPKNVVGRPVLPVSSTGSVLREEICIDFKNNLYHKVGQMGMKNYYVKGKVSPIKWEITDEHKVIQGYSCQMARGKYAGRSYTVWFSSDLPFSQGPWMLHGLPGLILEAEDSTAEVRIKTKSINRSSSSSESTGSFYNYDKVILLKDKDYAKALKMFLQDPESYTQAQVLGSKVTTVNEDSGEKSKVNGIKNYNPIERF